MCIAFQPRLPSRTSRLSGITTGVQTIEINPPGRKMATLEGGLYSIICRWGPSPTPNLQEFYLLSYLKLCWIILQHYPALYNLAHPSFPRIVAHLGTWKILEQKLGGRGWNLKHKAYALWISWASKGSFPGLNLNMLRPQCISWGCVRLWPGSCRELSPPEHCSSSTVGLCSASLALCLPCATSSWAIFCHRSCRVGADPWGLQAWV